MQPFKGMKTLDLIGNLIIKNLYVKLYIKVFM